MTDELFFKCINDIEHAFSHLIEHRYFNPQFPENQNIRARSPDEINNRLEVFVDNKWRVKCTFNVIKQIMNFSFKPFNDRTSYFKGDSIPQMTLMDYGPNKCETVKVLLPLIRNIEQEIESNHEDIQKEAFEYVKTFLLDQIEASNKEETPKIDDSNPNNENDGDDDNDRESIDEDNY